MRKLILAFIIPCVISCSDKQTVDTLLLNGTIYTVDSSFSVVEAMAIDDGVIVATGSTKQIKRKYEGKEVLDLNHLPVYPGFHDAHCHFYGYGIDKEKISLIGTRSFEEVLDVVKNQQNKRFGGWIFGRGWDQNDWEDRSFPDNSAIDSLFPDVPVILLRIDGHAALVNSKALDIAGISESSYIPGGELIMKDGKLTGVLLDNAVDSVHNMVPDASKEASVMAMMKAQDDCFAVGLTTVTDAGFKGGGLKSDIIEVIKEMIRDSTLLIRINAMASLDEISRYNAGRYTSEHLMVNGFKAYADGALGSRGACLLQPYVDKPGSHGFLIHEPGTLRDWIRAVDELNMQINIHCIGDSAHRFILKEYNNILNGTNPNRWRIEHAQVIDPSDLELYSRSGILPSVQPTHATSDMYWAEDRLGPDRLAGAYAYKSLLECNGIILNGSDFPVESINPIHGFYAAVARQDVDGYPENGFLPEQKLSREQALRAMTSWAAYGAFMEDITGSLEVGKRADLVILEKDLMTAPEEELWRIRVGETRVSGIKVHSEFSNFPASYRRGRM